MDRWQQMKQEAEDDSEEEDFSIPSGVTRCIEEVARVRAASIYAGAGSSTDKPVMPTTPETATSSIGTQRQLSAAQFDRNTAQGAAAAEKKAQAAIREKLKQADVPPFEEMPKRKKPKDWAKGQVTSMLQKATGYQS